MCSTWCTVGILPEVLNLILHCCKDYKFDNTPDPMNEIESLFQEVLSFLTAFARFSKLMLLFMHKYKSVIN